MLIIRRWVLDLLLIVAFGLGLFFGTVVISAKTQPAKVQIDCAKYLGVETIPDGTVLQAGGKTVKSWRIRNCGSSTWSGYKLVRVYGEGGNSAERKQIMPESFELPPLIPNQIGDILLPINIPATPGHYRLFVELANRDGYRFGDPLWVDIIVK